MSAYLLDVNVLVAMAWPRHSGHAVVQKWLARHAREGWASCPFTQAAFVRIISNPAFSRDALSPKQALALLRANLDQPDHKFWPAVLTVNEALATVGRVVGHQQITDAYLLGLALHNKGRLATLDRGTMSLLPMDSPTRAHIVVIS